MNLAQQEGLIEAQLRLKSRNRFRLGARAQHEAGRITRNKCHDGKDDHRSDQQAQAQGYQSTDHISEHGVTLVRVGGQVKMLPRPIPVGAFSWRSEQV